MQLAKQGKRRTPIRWALICMLIPGIIIVLIYSYGPLLGLGIAFQKFSSSKGLFGSPWVGFDNFRYIFKLPDFSRALTNTLSISSMKIFFGMLTPIVVAVLLNEMGNLAYKRIAQTFIYLPFFISWVIIAGIMGDLLLPSTGAVNAVIKAFGFEPIFFLADSKVFVGTMIVVDVWKGFGFGTILYLAAITGIDPSLYEAASIDGANRFKRMIYITLPGLVPIIILNGTLSLGNVLNAGFDQIVNMYSPLVYRVSDILDTLVYRVGIAGDRNSMPRYEIATAMGLFKSAVSFILISTAYWAAHKFADHSIF
jgi:ABC-type polysaccharide transport system, permease component